MKPADPNREQLIAAAKRLKPILNELVFVGGCATGLLITDPASASVRSTFDVDTIAEAATYAQYTSFGERLEKLGFQRDTSEGAPACRWLAAGLKLDVMPTNPNVIGFSNRWYPLALKTSVEMEIEAGISIRLISAPCFLATKLEAFSSRGAEDIRFSHDLEDILAVVDGRQELLDEVRAADSALQGFIARTLGSLLADSDFLEAVPGYLPADAATQARASQIIERLRALAKSE